MRLKQLSLLSFLLLTQFTVFGQKKIIDYTAYNDWKRIGETSISSTGEYSSYTITPLKGDGYLFLVNNSTGKKDSVARGKSAQFSADGKVLIFKIAPKQADIRKLELDKVKKDKWPKDSLGLWYVDNDSLVKIPDLKVLQVAEKGNVIAYQTSKNVFDKPVTPKLIKELSYYPAFSEKKSKELHEKMKYFKNLSYDKHIAVKSNGTVLNVLNLATNKKAVFTNVQDFEISSTGKYVGFTEQREYSKLNVKKQSWETVGDSLRIFVYNSQEHSTVYDPKTVLHFSGLNFSKQENALAGLFSQDSLGEKNWNLFKYTISDFQREILVDSTKKFEGERTISKNFTPEFVNNEQDVFFGVWDVQKPTEKDTLLESEKAHVDVWHWKDERIQPEQINQLRSDEQKSNLYVYHLKSKEIIQFGRDTIEIRMENKDQFSTMLAVSEHQYRSKNWESPNANDVYTLDVETGNLTPQRMGNHFDINLSPSGNFFSYFDDLKQQYIIRNTTTKEESCASCGSKQNYLSDLNGMPSMNSPIGVMGWTEGEKGVLIQADRDIVYYDLASKKTSSITTFFRTEAADTNFAYNLINTLNDSILYHPENCILTRFDKATKAMGMYRVSGNFPLLTYALIDASNHSFVGFKKAKNSPAIAYQKLSNADYPNLHVSLKDGETARQLSDANPQQAEYNWSEVELIKWTSYSGIPLEGLLYTPEDFDPNKNYPLLVYYYEMYSDDIHNHYAPKPTASIIFPTEYASAGYVVLIPDIRYTPGHPAKGAYDCIMSGTDAVLKKYSNVDSTRMGLQGQSWGGYQTAQLITMTNRYKVAMAGAPVSNMFSAYGGIRWGSGFSRQFQYEHTQSRIGKTIWEAPELYVENSPIFHLPKVNTPLLIMANDKDGAVPWYQGIELYMGLRRLDKPVWMFNYNDDDHNLLKTANKIDLSIRMRQYFDYYLMNAPAPEWLENGIPATKKGVGIQFDATK